MEDIKSEYPELREFIHHLQFEKRYSMNTVESYENDLGQFFMFLKKGYDSIPMKDITPFIVKGWLANLKQGGLVAKSINRKASSLRTFFKYQMRAGKMYKSPMEAVVAPKINKRVPAFLNHKETERLFDTVVFPDGWKGRTDRLVLELLYASGIRLSELLGLKESYIDFGYSQIKVLGKGNKERIIPIPRSLGGSLKEYMKEKPNRKDCVETLFTSEDGEALQKRDVYPMVKHYLSQVTTIDKKSPHIFRHSFATHLVNNGADIYAVKDLLGHSSLASTQIYAHTNIDMLKDVFKKAHPKA